VSIINLDRRDFRQPPADPAGAADNVAQPAAASSGQQASGLLFEAAVLREAGLLSPAYEGLKLAREYRYIKRPLIARALGRGATRAPNGYLIMIASAVSGEGKSFTAVNLALSLSLEKDLRVLLVDADVAKPHISRVLGLTEAPGLLDVLRDSQLSVERAILQTNIATLSFLPAGKPSAEATELLASRRMEQLATALGEHDSQRIVLFDSPPLLQSNESHALSQIAGQIVVVVRARSTSQPVLLDALEVLKSHPAVALVLNQSMQPPASPYHSGYGSERSDRVPNP
jgi:protein-tyrosine kinase